MSSKLFYMIGLFCLIQSCKNKSSKLDNSPILDIEINNEYLKREQVVYDFLDKNHLSYLNDTAKWNLYNIYCDYQLPSSIADSSKKIYLSYLPLKPLYYSIVNNSILEIYYSFLYNNLRVDNFPVDSNSYKVVNGIRFDLKTKKIIDFINGRGSFKIIGSKSRFENLIQPEILFFVKKNFLNLDEWYKESLVKHGIVQPGG